LNSILNNAFVSSLKKHKIPYQQYSEFSLQEYIGMKKIKFLLLLTTSICLSHANFAFAEWKELGSNEVMTVSVDLDTISTYYDLAQIVSMLDFKKPGVNPTNKLPVSSIIGLNEFNCPQISYRPIAYKEFSGNKGEGSVVSDVRTPDSKFEPVQNDSWTAGVFNTVCKKK